MGIRAGLLAHPHTPVLLCMLLCRGSAVVLMGAVAATAVAARAGHRVGV